MALSKHFKRSNLAQKIFELHAWVKKCHFGNFSERAGMAVPCQCGPQKCIIAFEKFFLFWVPMNIQKDWKAKLESAYSFMLKYSKITDPITALFDNSMYYCSHYYGYFKNVKTVILNWRLKIGILRTTRSSRSKTLRNHLSIHS